MNINCKSKQNPSEEHHILKVTNPQCQWLALKLTRNRSKLWRASGECPQRKQNYSLRRNDAGSAKPCPFRQTTQLLLIIEIAVSEIAFPAQRIGTTMLETNAAPKLGHLTNPRCRSRERNPRVKVKPRQRVSFFISSFPKMWKWSENEYGIGSRNYFDEIFGFSQVLCLSLLCRKLVRECTMGTTAFNLIFI